MTKRAVTKQPVTKETVTKISILCPSRGRPARLQEMILSVRATTPRDSRIEIDVLVDPDDCQLPVYRQLAYSGVNLHVADQRMTVPAAFQYLAGKARGDILMLGSDDILFRTPGWDDRVRETFARYPDGMALVYPSDGHGNGKPGDIKGNHWFVTRRWVDVVGCFCPQTFEHFCCDTVPEKIAALAGRFIHLPDVLIEHRHFKYGQAVKDDTYSYTRQRDANGLSMSDRDILKMNALQPWIEERAAAVREYIEKCRLAA